jgi:hypothetical protein
MSYAAKKESRASICYSLNVLFSIQHQAKKCAQQLFHVLIWQWIPDSSLYVLRAAVR